MSAAVDPIVAPAIGPMPIESPQRRSWLRRHGLLACCGWLPLAGCESYVWVEDVCKAFDHPQASDWVIGAVGDQSTFVDGTAVVAQWRLSRIDASDDSPTYNSEGQWETCENDRTLWFDRAATDDRLRQRFSQQRSKDGSRNALFLYLSPDDPLYATELRFDLTDAVAHVQSPRSGQAGRHDATRTIGTAQYTDVFEVTLQDLAVLKPGLSSERAWVRAVVARRVGLVQYELRDGRVFTRTGT